MNNSIKSVADLRREQQLARQRITTYEEEFKKKIQQLPGELAVASANNFIPRFLRGKITNTALSGGKFLIDKFFVEPDQTPRAIQATRKSGIVPFVKTVFRMFKGRK
jgi:hypothetical protein